MVFSPLLFFFPLCVHVFLKERKAFWIELAPLTPFVALLQNVYVILWGRGCKQENKIESGDVELSYCVKRKLEWGRNAIVITYLLRI